MHSGVEVVRNCCFVFNREEVVEVWYCTMVPRIGTKVGQPAVSGSAKLRPRQKLLRKAFLVKWLSSTNDIPVFCARAQTAHRETVSTSLVSAGDVEE